MVKSYKREDFIGDNGKILSKSLFYELSFNDSDRTLFTLKDTEVNGFVSFPKLYLQYTEDDPTEWTLATEVFTSWAIWETISKTAGLKPYVEELRKQNAIRQKSKAIKSIIKESVDGKNSFAASKLLLEKDLTDRKMKRLTKAQKAQSDAELEEAKKIVEQDAEIIKLRSVK